MEYGAITLDTSVFEQQGLKLESGILLTLEQFHSKPVNLVFSEIIIKEVYTHLRKKANESRRQVEKIMRESVLHLSVTKENIDIAAEVLIPKEEDDHVAKNRITLFIEKTGAEIVHAKDYVELDEVIKKYFEAEPPFAESGKKKNEFPDAIALMSLESWAQEKRIKILAVAKDGDWGKFAEQSGYIDVMEDLAEAISMFQPHTKSIEFCSEIAKSLPKGKPEYLYDSILGLLTDAIGEIYLHPVASSLFSYEADYVEVFLEEFEFVTDEDGNAILQPVQGQNNTLIVEAKFNISAEATTTFSLSIRDSIDKDYVSMGSATVSKKMEFELEALLTFEGNFESDQEKIDLANFELLSYPTEVDFGSIEPDGWWDE